MDSVIRINLVLLALVAIADTDVEASTLTKGHITGENLARAKYAHGFGTFAF